MSQTMYCLKQESFIFKTYYFSQPVLNAAPNLCSLDKTAFYLTFFSDWSLFGSFPQASSTCTFWACMCQALCQASFLLQPSPSGWWAVLSLPPKLLTCTARASFEMGVAELFSIFLSGASSYFYEVGMVFFCFFFWGGGLRGCWAFYFKLSERNHKGWEKNEGWAGRRGQQSPSCSKGEWDHLCLPLPKAHSTQAALLSQGTRDKSSLGHDGSPGAQGHAAIVRHIIVIKEQT